MSLTAATLARIRAEIAAGSSLFADRLAPGGPPDPAGFADLLAAACPNLGKNYGFALEYIFEGFLLHYRQGRLLGPSTPEFNLLAGDYMYARGLTYLAELEDLYCIRLMADLVSLCSFIHCEDRDSARSFNAWVAATACLAGRAAGRPGDDCLASFNRFKSNMMGGKSEAALSPAALAEFTAGFPGGARKLDDLLAALESLYWRAPGEKFQHGD